jgi:hypothetical protein
MTLLDKARQNRLIALAVRAEMKKRRTASGDVLFRSVRGDNLNRAPAAAVVAR